MKIFFDGWESSLELTTLECQAKGKTRLYICSPLGNKDYNSIFANMRRAREYMHYLNCTMLAGKDAYAVAPHGYLPVLLDDNDKDGREAAIVLGTEILRSSHAIAVCGDTISSGMREEIRIAAARGFPVYYFNPGLTDEILTLAKDAICLNKDYPLAGMYSPKEAAS